MQQGIHGMNKLKHFVRILFFCVAGAGSVAYLALMMSAAAQANWHLVGSMMVAIAAAAAVTAMLFIALNVIDRLLHFLFAHIKLNHLLTVRVVISAFMHGSAHLGMGYGAASLVTLFPVMPFLASLMSVGYLGVYFLWRGKGVASSRIMLPVAYLIACLGFIMVAAYPLGSVPRISMLVLVIASAYGYFKFLSCDHVVTKTESEVRRG